MRSEKQREASRINGAKSRGPKTPEGKRISAMNAVRTSLLSKTLLIPGESRAHFEAHLRQFIGEHRPLPGNETILVESMATWRWKQLRLMAFETAILSHEIGNHRAMTPDEPLSDVAHAALAMLNLTDRSNLLSHLAAEQRRCEVQYSRALRLLRQSQANRGNVFRPAEPGVPGPEPFNSLRHAPDTPEKKTQTEPEAKPHQPDPDTGGPTQDLKPNADECTGIVHSEPGCQAEHVCTTTGRCDCQSRCRTTSHPTVQSEPR